MQDDKVYCPVCSLAIAHHDPERCQRGLNVYHEKCWRKECQKPAIPPKAKVARPLPAHRV